MDLLRAEELEVRFPGRDEPILSGVSVEFAGGKMNALVGPSGCGKTTLMRAFLGAVPYRGKCCLGEETIRVPESLVGKVGYVPQFCLAHRLLTVREVLEDTARMHLSGPERNGVVERVLQETSLDGIAGSRVGMLSGGQQRRLALALEMVPDPRVYLCDEVTTGLDPAAEDEILSLLERLNRERGATFVNIIHNLAQLPRFDAITVLYGGGVAYSGSWTGLREWFQIEDAVDLYRALAKLPAEEWVDRWRDRAGELGAEVEPETGRDPELPLSDRGSMEEPVKVSALATRFRGFEQFSTLMRRRLRLFFRDRAILGLTLAITFGFPLLVVIFALDGLPAAGGLWSEGSTGGMGRLIRERFEDTLRAIENGSLVSGLILFQVILLGLVGSNNGSREIAGERDLFEKERLRGLSVGAYVSSKLCFVGILAAGQGLWMALFVKAVCRFPGDLFEQAVGLVLVTVAMSWICLGFSALLKSEDRAQLLSIYLVGFQLPLSGIVLALPDVLIWLFRPLISAYWGWAVYLGAFRDDPLYDAVVRVNREVIPNFEAGVILLGSQAIFGAILVWLGCRQRRPVK